VAALLGAQPVVTTASDATGLPALDQLRGCVVRGDVAGVTAARLDGISPVVENEIGWPLPPEWAGGVGPTWLVVTDRAVDAVARRRRPRGHLTVVGLGPGRPAHRTPAASAAVRSADVVVGYGPYVDQAADLLDACHEVVRSAIGDEVVRAKQAVAEATAGRS